MSTIKAILEPSEDGTLHLPLPPDLRGGKIEVTATMRRVEAPAPSLPKATPEMLRRRKEAYDRLKTLGGLRQVIPDPVAWQRQIRSDRPLPGRD